MASTGEALPLSRDSITASSRVMLPVYAVFSCYLAACYTLGDPDRTATPSFDVIREVLPGGIRTWGFVMFGLAVIEVAALISRRRLWFVFALCVGFGCYISWAFGFLVAALTVESASLSGPGVWLFVALCHIATLQSLTRDSWAMCHGR